MVLWLGEYQALTIAGCISQTSLCGDSLSVTRSDRLLHPNMLITVQITKA